MLSKSKDKFKTWVVIGFQLILYDQKIVLTIFSVKSNGNFFWISLSMTVVKMDGISNSNIIEQIFMIKTLLTSSF